MLFLIISQLLCSCCAKKTKIVYPGKLKTNSEVVQELFYSSYACDGDIALNISTLTDKEEQNGLRWDCPANNTICLAGDKHKIVFGSETSDNYSNVCEIYKKIAKHLSFINYSTTIIANNFIFL